MPTERTIVADEVECPHCEKVVVKQAPPTKDVVCFNCGKWFDVIGPVVKYATVTIESPMNSIHGGTE